MRSLDGDDPCCCRETLAKTAELIKKFHEGKALESPELAAGQLVLLEGRNSQTRRPSRKLGRKMLGPFKVVKVLPGK